MSKTLILITNHFPFGTGEAFIQNEFKFLSNHFSKIWILSRDISSTEIREGNFNYKRINPESNWKEILLLIPLSIKHVTRIFRYKIDEIKILKASGRLRLSVIKIFFHDLVKALIISHHISALIKNNKIKGDVTLYSYWLTSSALATTFVHVKDCQIKRIARAHGGDIYEERNENSYLSFRNTLAKNLDRIYSISENGLKYLKEKINSNLDHKLAISRLGIESLNGSPLPQYSKNKIIVSCSFMVPVKRIDLIIETISLITNHSIEWIHIGGGPLEDTMKRMAFEKLSSKENIKYSFKGTSSPAEIQSFYSKNGVYLFINASSSEGIPVTMMEAQSFGIPILGLDVGGVREIVNNKNGRVLAANSDAKTIAAALTQMLYLSKEEYEGLRMAARLNWSLLYNAEKNFSTFADQISTLHNEAG